MTRSGRHAGVLIGLGILVLVCFAGTLRNTEFVLDNRALILQDPRLRAPLGEALREIFRQDYWYPTFVSGLYRPLTTLSFAVNATVLGSDGRAAGYHAVNLILHWVNASLVYALALSVMRKAGVAAWTAALFAVHPIVTEAVTNLVGRADLLAALCVLGGLVCYARALTAAGRPARTAWLAALAGLAVAGVFSKEVAVVILPLVILLDATLARADPAAAAEPGRRRSREGPGRSMPSLAVQRDAASGDFDVRAEARPDTTAGLLRPVDTFLLGPLRRGAWVVLPSLVAFWAARGAVFAKLPPPERPVLDNPLLGEGFLVSRLTAIKVIGKELALLVWPRWLSCDYSFDQIPIDRNPFTSWESAQALIALGILAGLAALALRLWRAGSRSVFWIGVFFIALLPTSNLVVEIGSIMAERFLYLPSVGFAGGVAALLFWSGRRLGEKREWWVHVVLAVAVAGFGARTYARNADWQSDLRLWTSAVRACPNSYKTHAALAEALADSDPSAGALDAAIAEAEKALAITDRSHSLLVHLGSYDRRKGDILSGAGAAAAAAAGGETAAAALPQPADGPAREWYIESAAVLERARPLDRAHNEEYRRRELARGRRPEDIPDVGSDEIYWNLGLTRLRLGDTSGALEAYTYARHLDPASAEASFDVASALIAAGRRAEAIRPLWQTLLLDAKHVRALTTLAGLYRSLDPGGCAVVEQPAPTLPGLNLECPVVHGDVCAAEWDLAKLFEGSRRPSLAVRARQEAVRTYGCAPDGASQ